MANILEVLYDAPIADNRCLYPPDSSFVQAANIKSEALEKLADALDEEQQKRLEDYENAQGEMESIRCFHKFCYGFQLGALIMEEIERSKEKL